MLQIHETLDFGHLEALFHDKQCVLGGCESPWGGQLKRPLSNIMAASGSRSEFPEWSGDTWSQHRLLTAQGTGDVPETSR